MVGEACLPSNAYYPRTPDYTLYSGVHVCWSEHSDSSFIYGFMSLDYGFGTRTAITYLSLDSPEAAEGTCDQVHANAQADLSLRWSHRLYCRFCRALAHLLIFIEVCVCILVT